MLTGDHQNSGNSIAKQIGLTDAKGNFYQKIKYQPKKRYY